MATALADDASVTVALQAIVDGEHRSVEHRGRNQYRHPAETLAFFGIRDDMIVVEISPGGGGWYTEILAPYLRENGALYAGNYDPKADEQYYQRNSTIFREKMAASPDLYDKVRITVFDPPAKLEPAPASSVDMVVTFRNFHNWIGDGDPRGGGARDASGPEPGWHPRRCSASRVIRVWNRIPKADSGYVRQDYLVQLIESVGFRLGGQQ